MINKIAVGTESSLKLRAVKTAMPLLGLDMEVVGAATDSGVPDQPFGVEQIYSGAVSRAKSAMAQLKTNIGIGIENGLIEISGCWYDPPCVAIFAGDNELSIAFGAFLPIPTWAVERVKADGSELGVVVQEIAGGGEKDPHQYFTNGIVDREVILVQALLCAFAPINSSRYKIPVG